MTAKKEQRQEYLKESLSEKLQKMKDTNAGKFKPQLRLKLTPCMLLGKRMY